MPPGEPVAGVIGIEQARANDLRGNDVLAAHRVDGHNPPLEFKQFQQLRDGGDLVGLILRCLLAQNEPVGCSPRR